MRGWGPDGVGAGRREGGAEGGDVLPIIVDGKTVGAVGVSGGSSEQGALIAKAATESMSKSSSLVRRAEVHWVAPGLAYHVAWAGEACPLRGTIASAARSAPPMSCA